MIHPEPFTENGGTALGLLVEHGLNEPGVRLVVSGHSLGGAMAVMFSAFLVSRERRKPDLLVTFGQPSCGNRQFMEWFGSLELPYFRCVNEGDLVATVPPTFKTHFWGHPGVGILFLEDSFKEKEMKTELWPIAAYLFVLVIGWLLEKFGRPEFKEKKVTALLVKMLTDKHDRVLYRDRANKLA